MKTSHSQRRLAAIRKQLHDIAVREEGAGYTLSYVMVIPFYALLMCLIVETTLVLTAKVGTVYAGYAAARTAVVWSSSTNDWNKAEERIKWAALKSFVPFASATMAKPFDLIPSQKSIVYGANYRLFADQPNSLSFVQRKFGYAKRAMKVTVQPPATFDADITVLIEYDFPFNVPGIGRLIGRRGFDGGFYYRLSTEVAMQNEASQNVDQTLGIGYGIQD